MTNDFQSNGGAQNGRRIINEADYQFHAPKESGPACVGKGGDPLFMNIRATKEQLTELLDETTTVQDWVQRETCNNIALACLDNQNLREIYFEIKNGFADYGPIVLMGFKTPQGVEIPRLKLLDKEGNVIQVLTGPLAIDELNKRAKEWQQSKQHTYEEIVVGVEENDNNASVGEVLQEYSGNPADYS